MQLYRYRLTLLGIGRSDFWISGSSPVASASRPCLLLFYAKRWTGFRGSSPIHIGVSSIVRAACVGRVKGLEGILLGGARLQSFVLSVHVLAGVFDGGNSVASLAIRYHARRARGA